jgi:hypothetical protein
MSATPTSVEKKAAAVLDSIASYNGVEVPSLYMAYCWCKMSYVSNIKEPSPGTAWFADFGLTHHYGNCYVMAATFTTFARLLGYDAVEISGEVPLVSGAIGPHSWVEIRTSQGTYVCDPDLESELGVNYYWIQYHQISAGSSYYIVGDGRHVKYHRLLVMN